MPTAIGPQHPAQVTYEGNRATSIIETYLVTGLTQTDTYDAMAQAIATSGIPSYGDSHSSNSNLGVTRITPRTLGTDNPNKAYIEVEYGTWGSVGNSTQFVFSGSTALQEVTSQNDAFGNQVTVTHTFPSGHTLYSGETQTLGAEFQALAPHSTVSATGNVQTAYPHRWARSWTGHLNAFPWAGEQAYTWIVASIDWRSTDVTSSPATFEFTFTFQHDPTGWQPQVVIIDPETGVPPANVVAGVGAKEVTWYPWRDFNQLFAV